MAGPWIKIEHVTPDKWQVGRIAQRINSTPEHALGKLIRMWVWFSDHTRKGHSPELNRETLDLILCEKGFSDAAIEAGWLTEVETGLKVPAFSKHIGSAKKKRVQSAKRARDARARSALQERTILSQSQKQKQSQNISDSDSDSGARGKDSGSGSDSGSRAAQQVLRLQLLQHFGIPPSPLSGSGHTDKSDRAKQARADDATFQRIIRHAVTATEKDEAAQQGHAVWLLAVEAKRDAGHTSPIKKFMCLVKARYPNCFQKK